MPKKHSDSDSRQFQEYKSNRYLRCAKDENLNQRLKDIATNLWSTDRDGNITPPRNRENRETLLRLYIETLCEKCLRNPADYEFNEADLRKEISSNFVKPILKTSVNFEPLCLSKFGSREHILESFNTGRLRIAPAMSYNDPSLNSAQMDNELSHYVQTSNEHLKLKLYGLEDGKTVELAYKPKELFRYKEGPDFYV